MTFSAIPKRFRTIRAQLILWYSVIFLLSYAVLFALARFSLSASLQKQDHEFIRNELREYALRYATDGPREMLKEVAMEKNVDGYRQTVTRLADSTNRTLYLSVAPVWRRYDLIQLERIAPRHVDDIVLLPKPNDEDRLEVATVKLNDGNLLQVGIDSGDRNDSVDNFSKLLLFGAIAVIFIGAGSGVLLAARWLRPIQHLATTIRSISETGLMSARVISRGSDDELDQLGSLFNRMLERIEALINGMRDSLDNIAHDLRTPMTRLRNTAENALEGIKTDGACREALSDCLEQSDQAMTMLKTLMDISEAETGALQLNLQAINLSDVVEEVVDVYRYVAEEKNIALTLDFPSKLEMEADRNRLKQVIGNLLDNAIKYTEANGRVHISARRQPSGVELTIKDNGIGIPARDQDRIWERLYRGDASRSQKGLGLGLSLVKAIVVAHKGRIDVDSRAGEGAAFIVHLPAGPNITNH
jgi:signal transduction histidine kinase